MGQYFSHEEVFPEIARLIRQQHSKIGSFVGHDQLVSAMIKNSLIKRNLDFAVNADPRRRDSKYWASQMIQWFSQKITEEKSDYFHQFDREQIDGAWAYKPRS